MNKNMGIELLRFPHKRLRARVIKSYMKEAGYDRAVCFSCGNAARELQDAGVETLHIGKHGVLTPRKWFQQAEIQKVFPHYFDATSGHLPADAMYALSLAYREYLGELREECYYVPTGSGETIVCLKMAYPRVNFAAVYDLDEATEYSEWCPLNAIVAAMASKIIFADGDADWGKCEVTK